MKSPTLKTIFLAFAIAATAAIGNVLITSCSTATPGNRQARALNSNSELSNKQHHGMHHQDMHHNINLGDADVNYDLRFIDAMIPHHEGAVVMAQEAIKKSQRPEIKNLANQIIQAQNKEINLLKQWRQAWYATASKQPQAWNPQMKHMMAMSAEQIKAMRMDMDLGAADAEFDLRFINAMIPHHEGAIVMAKDTLGKAKHKEIKTLAQAIISAQKSEIVQMQQWRKAWYKV